MALYLSFLNLLTGVPGVPGIVGRLTTVFRRNAGQHSRQILLSQSGQSPPNGSPPSAPTRRRQRGLWVHRIQAVRLNDLSPHLRRDIGLDA